MSLKKWFKQDWVDISAPKKGGGFQKVWQILSLKKQKRLPQMRAGSESCPHDQG